MTYNEAWAKNYVKQIIDNTEVKIAKAYKQASNTAKAQIADLFERYADKGVLTYAEMSKYNRLNNLYKTLTEELNESWNVVLKDIKTMTGDVYEESFYRYGFSMAHDTGINLSFGLIDKGVINSLYNEPNVSGLSLKETLSKTRYALLLKERQEITQSFLLGESYPKAAKRISKTFNKSFKDALRIARTEGTRAANDAQVACYDEAEEMGIEFDRIWLATLDSRTRDSHGAIDGQVADKEGYFHYKGYKAKAPGGWGVAELNINCRCSIISKPKDIEFRVRRSNIGDKNIIDYTSYQEWKKDQKKA